MMLPSVDALAAQVPDGALVAHGAARQFPALGGARQGADRKGGATSACSACGSGFATDI